MSEAHASRGGDESADTVSFLAHIGPAPVVLVFADDWTRGSESVDDLDVIRAELRGLGAVLAVLSRAGIWSFRPDDDFERLAGSSCDVDAEVARLVRRYGIERGRDGLMLPTVVVLDAEGRVRFQGVWSRERGDVRSGLAGALHSAGRALLERSSEPGRMSRREWIVTSLVAGFAFVFAEGCARRVPQDGDLPKVDPSTGASDATGEFDITLDVNGATRSLRIDPRVSLLDALRDRVGLTGTKKGCDQGQCGACTVLVDGRRVCSCLTLAIMARGAKITTIEGLATGDRLHPVQAAFASMDAFQCGYCTPGQIMSAVGLLAEGHAKTDDDVREQMSGNICRCGAYSNIVAAIQLARRGG
jgi:xanthine dehydrogenase YagT iron-sulfur-binding subunit